MLVSDHYPKKYSRNPIQTWCVYLLGECSQFFRFWAKLAKFWPSRGHKMPENVGFWPISEKIPLCGIMITQSISNMVFPVARGVFTNRLHSPNLAPLVPISVFPFPLIRPQAGACILWCLVKHMFCSFAVLQYVCSGSDTYFSAHLTSQTTICYNLLDILNFTWKRVGSMLKLSKFKINLNLATWQHWTAISTKLGCLTARFTRCLVLHGHCLTLMTSRLIKSPG